MLLNEVRKRYLSYMEREGHYIAPSAPLVPKDDNTTLFTVAGMQPFIPYLLGKEHERGKRIVNSQKCFRAVDIDEVGDNRHTTFFEMLGNWSFGDYFKEKQIRQCFTFLTDSDIGLGLNPERLYITVFAGDEKNAVPRDDTAAELWKELFAGVGIDAGIAHIGSQEEGDRRGMRDGERIFFYDSGKNWWSRSGKPEDMPPGEIGGPDTEVFYDFGEAHADPAYARLKPHPNTDSGRFIEICNSVFIEYARTETGFEPLPKKNVDFGGGLERLTAVTENTPDAFRIDVFRDALRELEEHSSLSYETQPEPFRVIMDHVRAALFLIADGVRPSNTTQGYVLRRLLRGALYHLRYVLKAETVPLARIAACFIPVYREQYPEVAESDVVPVMEAEERQFAATLRNGMKKFEEFVKRGLTGEDVFILQSTYGFPKELTVMLANERDAPVSLEGYETAMRAHRDSSRQAGEKRFKGGLGDTDPMSVRYHTATHLLHQALREVLGDGVVQKGSNITPERLRFDFSYDKKLTDEEKQQVEEKVNNAIRAALPVSCQDMPIDEARKTGAIGVFEYGDTVRVYSIGEYSKEFCGGPHVENTSELGSFRITGESSVAAGIRRIKAVLE